jgi:acyl-CoA dehydrogenase
MNDIENVVVATAERIFSDLADPQAIIQSRSDEWRGKLWNAVEDVGLSLAWVPDTLGGGGASIDDGFGIIRAAGRGALASPLAETLLAGWLLGHVGLEPPGGPMSVAPTRPNDRLALDGAGRLSGRARKIAFARDARHLAVLASSSDGNVVALVRTEDCRLKAGVNLAGDPCDTVEFANVVPLAVAKAGSLGANALLLMGATVRAQQIAGALEKALELSVRYSMERIAFEKPISKFQAVQHNLARLGGEVAAAVSAAASAVDTIAESDLASNEALLEIAAAKIRCGEAAETGTGIAHQVHGAIGFTDEHVLHRFTLRALSWRNDFGDETFWSLQLGELIADLGAEQLWPLLASR